MEVRVNIALPDGNGFTVCTEIKDKYGIPDVFITASGDEASVVTGLNMGADDYVTKPFRPRELLARISATLRKSGNKTELDVAGLSVNTASGIVKKDGKEIVLSVLDYRLLLVFINNPGSIIPRQRLMDELWDAAGEYVTGNTLTVYIKRLRERIEDDPARPGAECCTQTGKGTFSGFPCRDRPSAPHSPYPSLFSSARYLSA